MLRATIKASLSLQPVDKGSCLHFSMANHARPPEVGVETLIAKSMPQALLLLCKSELTPLAL